MYLEIIYLIYMYKRDLALNNLQWLIYYKPKPNLYFYYTNEFQMCTLSDIPLHRIVKMTSFI